VPREPDAHLHNFFVRSVILQPATACNLNCKYCYLPYRRDQNQMNPAVTESLALDIHSTGRPIQLLWHGCEPLACGITRLRRLLTSFTTCGALAQHALQTNATLITETWCDLFEEHSIEIGVSIDGPRTLNASRVDWRDTPAFDQAVRGIRTLQNRSIRFSVIAVITRSALGSAKEILNFFVDLGCPLLGINIEEQEGINVGRAPDDSTVSRFWEDLFNAWSANPVIKIREFSRMVKWMVTNNLDPTFRNNIGIDLLPSIAYNGDVVLLSPEFLGMKDPRYDDFVVGNILKEPLTSLLSRAHDVSYVQQYSHGVNRCRASCEFYFCCGGGHASNKYFENDDLATTETSFCRNTKQRLVNIIVENC
jgi:uncharacterized protein